MKTTLNIGKEIKITSTFLGNKSATWNTKNYNNHRVTLTYNKNTTWFEFWNSIQEGEITTREDLLYSFRCFVSDASIYEQYEGYKEDFIKEFGYDNKEGKKVFNNCKKAYDKFNKLFDYNMNINKVLEVLDDMGIQ